MSLRDVPLKGVYRTATDSLVRDFYLPCLAQATHYDRAVGFFSSSMLLEAATGLSGLIKNKGRMRLVIGHPLSDEDWDAVQSGVKLSVIQSTLLEELGEILERAGSDRSVQSLELLSWMVATSSLEMRFAFRRLGMYHEKIGIVGDAQGNRIVFNGSPNESANALLPTRNFESLSVFPSWKVEVFEEYGEPFARGFRDLWENTTPDLVTVPVPSQFYELLLKYRQDNHTPPNLDLEEALYKQIALTTHQNSGPKIPSTFSGQPYALREHQEKALKNWRASSYSGIFALATGSGKTVTALHAATKFSEQGYPLVLIVAVPYQILAEQWVSVMEQFSMSPIRAFYSRDNWVGKIDEAITAFVGGALKFLSIVVVNDTLASKEFLDRLNRIPPENIFFVGDECHHHASEGWIARIPSRAKFRLGLSATPWDPGRDLQKAILERIYGQVVASYSLGDALRDRVLSEYSYHWVPCAFDDDEADEYERLSKQISSLYSQDPGQKSPSIQTRLKSFVARRSRLIGALRSKRQRLKQMLSNAGISPHTLFYCGEGQHPLEQDATDANRIIDSTIVEVASTGRNIGRITASESTSERQRVLNAFDDGLIDSVAAIRVLDEGFDIPSCRIAFMLASSGSYRQYVQRRGRVLRKAPGKRSAQIFDFVAIPSSARLKQENALWRRQISLELVRIRDFVALASNALSQQIEINDKMEFLGLGAIYYEYAPVSEELEYED